MAYQVEEFRKKFPQLERQSDGRPVIYFDNGASTLKHSNVTDRVNSFNRFEVSNVHRGAHQVSRLGTEAYEAAREKLRQFINAKDSSEIVFTRGTTESLNMVAHGLASQLKEGDEILISPFEHHSNIVPWQVLCEQRGCTLKVIPFDPEAGFVWQSFLDSLSERTKVVSVLMYSNSFGNRLPVEKIVEECKSREIISVIDAAQAVLTESIDVQAIKCDFLCFSGHKMYGPYGIGLLYGRSSMLEKLPPYQTGGSMIDRVTFEKTSYAAIPQKFEAGTPNITGAIGFGEAAEQILQLGITESHDHVVNLRSQVKAGLLKKHKCTVYEFASETYCGALSFNIEGAHCSDVGTLLDRYQIAVRSGHHCTQPLMDLVGVPGTVRVSLAPYNTVAEINYFFEILDKVEEFF